MTSNQKKHEQLGMPIGTASSRLKKSIIFSLLKKSGDNVCHQCKQEIESEDELSIEHKIPYLDSENPAELFFDLENIAFSHLSCNIKAKRPRPKYKHGESGYRQGCRCDECKEGKRKSRGRDTATQF